MNAKALQKQTTESDTTLTNDAQVLRQWLDATLMNGFPHRRTAIESWQPHTPFVSALVSLFKPSLFVELGTHMGDSYCAVCETVSARGLATRCVAVDCWQGDDHAGEYGHEVLAELRSYHDPRYGSFSRLNQSFFDEAVQLFEDSEIDLLHIDGLHTAEAVRHDFETWRPKLSSRAVVLFHDTQVRDNDFGVYKVWAALSQEFPHFEFHHGNGLGILLVGPARPHPLVNLCALQDQTKQRLRDLYEALGAAVLFKGRSGRLWKQVDELWARTHIAEENLEQTKNDLDQTKLELHGINTSGSHLWERIHLAEDQLKHYQEAYQAAWQRIAKAEEDLQIYRSAHDEAWARIHATEQALHETRTKLSELEASYNALYKLTRPFLGIARLLARLRGGESP